MADRKSERPKRKKAIETQVSRPARQTSAGPPPPEDRPATWRFGRLFWGALLVLLGGLILLNNFDIIDVRFGNLWRLWPLLIIAAGVSMLAVRGWLAVTLTVALMVASLGLIGAVAVGNLGGSAEVTTTNVQVTAEADVTAAEVTVRAGAGKLDIESADSVSLVEARLDSNFTELERTERRDGDTQHVALELDGSPRWWQGGTRNDLAVKLTENLPVSLEVDAGASDVDARLASVWLRSVDIDAGASNIELELGEVAELQEVSLRAGASAVIIRVPRASGVRVDINGGLTDRNMADLIDRGGGRFETDGYDQSVRKINITADLGLARISIVRY